MKKLKKYIDRELKDLTRQAQEGGWEDGYVDIDRLNGEEGYNLGWYRCLTNVKSIIKKHEKTKKR